MSLTLNKTSLDQLFPAHIQIDKQACILTLGPSLQRHLTEDAIGKNIGTLFSIEFPQKLSRQSSNNEIRDTILTGRGLGEGLALRGGVMKSDKGYIFLLGHAFSKLEAVKPRELNFSDFSPTDDSIDLFIISKFHEVLLNETRVMSQEVTQKKRLAEAASLAKTQFLANMSHEIRTPMNGVLGMAQVMANLDLPPKQREIIETILKSGETLMEILNDILEISRIESGKLSLHPADVNVCESITRAVECHRNKANQKGLSLTLNFAEECSEKIIIDGLRLEQCLSNLVANAIKFTDKGAVSIYVTSEYFKTFQRTTIKVSDTGIGIAKESQAELFEPFTQADNSKTREYGGSGLGLSISKKFANLMGGDIKIQSEPGKGSVFTLTFDANRAEMTSAMSDVA